MLSIQGDDLAWEESDRLEKEWRENLVKPDIQQAIGKFIAKHRKGLKNFYRQVSGILIQLSKLEFPSIGPLQETSEWQWHVGSRPLSMPINELVRTGAFPRAKVPFTSFHSSSNYFETLALLHIDHLAHQRNDAIESETDCQRKYTARKLFQKLAQEKKSLFRIAMDHLNFGAMTCGLQTFF